MAENYTISRYFSLHHEASFPKHINLNIVYNLVTVNKTWTVQ